eukprot:3708651-Rhodomonas_salina.1
MGRPADVSWFRPFGCRATVYPGKKHIEHYKLPVSPRGEPGVFVGLGLSEGKKEWLVFVPHLNRIFAS